MDRRGDRNREIQLALTAFEAGAVDREQLASAIECWAREPERSMAEILATVDPEGSSGAPEPTTSYVIRPVGDPPASANRPREAPDPSAGSPRFEVLRPHARGGLGQVFIALDRELNRSVALKELQARFADDPASRARFVREAEVTGKLAHPGIVPIYSLGRYPDGRPYYAMHFIEGETLREAIARFHVAGSPRDFEGRELAFRRLLRSVIDACNAVAYAHSRGVVHRDLKPENVMLGRFGETLVVDWGVAKWLGEPDEAAPSGDPEADLAMTRPGSVLGTPRFMSPEQAAGDLDRVGPASDIYGLGAILYSVLAGRSPFPGDDLVTILDLARRGIFPSPRRVRRTIDPVLEAICLKAMALDPRDRHASALALAAELETWLADVRYRREHEVAVEQVRRSLARLCLEKARGCFDREAPDHGMLWLARALETVPPDPPELERVIRTSLDGWHGRGKLLERGFRHADGVSALAFCPEGRKLATASLDGTGRLWDVATGSKLSGPMPHDGPIRAVAFRPDGALLLTAGDDGSIRPWDSVTGTPAGTPWHRGAAVAWLGFSPDGSRLAATTGTGEPVLWESETGAPLPGPRTDDARVLAMAFSPDGAIIAIATEGGGVRFRDCPTGRTLGDPLDPGSSVVALAFDPGGRTLLVAGEDGNL